MLVLFFVCFFNEIFTSPSWETFSEKEKKAALKLWWGDLKASKRALQEQIARLLLRSPRKVAWMSDFKQKSTNRNCTLSSFVMFTAAWTDSTGRNQQLCDLISAFTVYNIVQCLWKTANSLEYCALLSPVLLWWNVTVQFDLCILKIHSFLLLYIYMCPCMFVQKKKINVYFLYFVTACLNIT